MARGGPGYAAAPRRACSRSASPPAPAAAEHVSSASLEARGSDADPNRARGFVPGAPEQWVLCLNQGGDGLDVGSRVGYGALEAATGPLVSRLPPLP